MTANAGRLICVISATSYGINRMIMKVRARHAKLPVERAVACPCRDAPLALPMG